MASTEIRRSFPNISPKRDFSATMMEENISNAEEIITKWDPEGSAYSKITSIFHEGRSEVRQFISAVSDLKRAMNFFMADSAISSAELLVKSQRLMKPAMRRLEKEFHLILSSNRDYIDRESTTLSDRSQPSAKSSSSQSNVEDDEISAVKESIDEVEKESFQAMSDLRSIAECMISCGYSKECVNIYKTVRRSIVDEGLYKLGFDMLSPTQVQKLDWDALQVKIQNWLAASKVAVRTLFAGERALCDNVFASSESIRESCFAKIARDPAIYFLGFPELAAQKTKKSPEKVFRMLDLYDAIAELFPEIEFIFSLDSTSAVRTQAESSLRRLADAVRSLVCDFEAAIQKDASKVSAVGGLHPLTRYTMNYLIFLADYSDALTEIYSDQPFQLPVSMPETMFNAVTASSAPPSPAFGAGENSAASISLRFAWLILVLLCKLDGKAQSCPKVSLSYLFLANNLWYVVNKVCGSHLKDILGDEWVSKHESKVRSYAASYERLAWGKVLTVASAAALTNAAEAREAIVLFNEVFTDACREQTAWIVPDGKMKDELKLSVARKVIPEYKNLYTMVAAQLREEKGLSAVRLFTPDDLANHLSELFSAGAASGSRSGSSPGSRKPLS